jgi:hypothetical protein
MQNGYAAAMRILLLGLVVAIGARSQAAPIVVEVRSDNVLVQTWNSAALGCAAGPPGVEFCNGIVNQSAGAFQINNLNLTVQSLAIANAVISVDNLDTSSHRLTVDIILTVPSTGLNLTGVSGALGGSITDGITDPVDVGDDNAVMSNNGPGTAFYTALLDNNFYQALGADPLQLGPTATSASLTPSNFGLPNPPGQAGPAIASTITLRYDFTLTPRDQAGLNGNLRVTVVPEPSTAMLLVLGLAALAQAGRRR